MEWVVDTFIDDFKTKAFESAFLQPAHMFLHAIRATWQRDDVEVHASNFYSALVLSTLGVLLPQPPLLSDPWHVMPEFLTCAALGDCYNELLQPANFGASWRIVPKCKSVVKRFKEARILKDTPVGFFEPKFPYEVANKALAPGFECSYVVPYLQRFTRCFEPPFFLPKLFDALMADSGLPEILVRLFPGFLRQVEPASVYLSTFPINTGSIYSWIHSQSDEEEEDLFNPVFQVDKALIFLDWCLPGIFRSSMISSSSSL